LKSDVRFFYILSNALRHEGGKNADTLTSGLEQTEEDEDMANDSKSDGRSHQHWLQQYGLKPYHAMTVGMFFAAIFLTLSYYDVDSYLDAKLADPVNFRIRDYLGASPQQSPKLKIFGYDDKAFAKFGTPMPDLATWAAVLDSIAQRKPKVIVIDALFGAKQTGNETVVNERLKKVKSYGVPVVSGAFTSKQALKFRHPLNRNSSFYSAQTYLDPINGRVSMNERIADELPNFKNREGWDVYGPSSEADWFFDRAGHFNLFQDNKIEPFLWLGGDKVVPHISSSAADRITFKDKRLIIDGKSVALGRHGEMSVNFLPPGTRAVKSFLSLQIEAVAGKPSSFVEEGDVVLILPMYFTGNVDIRPSPYGWVPGGFYVSDSLNSILKSEYLQPVLVGNVLTVCLIAISLGLVYSLSASVSWVAWLVFAGLFFGSVQLAFSYAALVIPYILPLMAGTSAGVSLYAIKVRKVEQKSNALRAALDGAVSPTQLLSLIRKPDDVNLEPRERIVTLMFIDIVGFSLSSENMAPRDAFTNLKSILMRISEIVHEHGGIIDKTLGDGLLAYFGYRFDSDETNSDHPEAALRCAIKIQEQMLEESLLAARASSPIYPLRIGLNTASCFLGDLGSGRRIEFTVVGNGVNFAKRLESDCRVFCVMIGSTTYELVKGLPWSEGIFARKVMKIKHHSDLRDAVEVNPLRLREAEVSEVLNAFNAQAILHRAAERMHVRDIGSIFVQTNAGRGLVLDFTASGASVLFDMSRTRGDVLEIRFDSRVPGLSKELDGHGIRSLEAEVRWTHAAAEGFVHGLVFKNLRADQHELFVRLLSSFAFSEVNDQDEGRHDADQIAS